jgi:hypothetical protein
LRRKKSSGIAQLLDDGTGKIFFDFSMARNRPAHLGAGILVPIGLSAMSDEYAAHPGKFLDEFDALHAICSPPLCELKELRRSTSL